MRLITTMLLAGILLLGIAAAADEAPTSTEPSLIGVEMFPLSDLRPGLKGKALTVIRGTEIVEFDVEVLELIPDGGFDGGPMILSRFSGEVVDFSDGIAGGYSGSPVYIDGKLVGAVSMAMPFTDTHIGGITPIRQMLKSLPDSEEPDYSGNSVLPDTENSGIPLAEDGTVISYVTDISAAQAHNDETRAAGGLDYQGVPSRTPFYFSGVSPDIISEYSEKFSDLFGDNFQLMEMPVGKSGDQGLFLRESGDAGLFLQEQTDEPPLKPGDTCVVVLAEGDVELFGLGTVTYTDADNRFLIFGHGMFNEGSVAVPLGKGYVTWVYGSIQRAFKAGVRLNTLGVMTRDHSAGCGGSFDLEPDMIPVRLKIKDIDRSQAVTKRFSIIRHRDYTPMLISMGLSQAATEVLDRRPSGTLKLSYHIEGVGLKEPLRRTNYFYDDYSVFSNGAYELMPIADLLANNIYRDVQITKIDILAEMTNNRINASIDDAEIVEPDDDGVKLRQAFDSAKAPADLEAEDMEDTPDDEPAPEPDDDAEAVPNAAVNPSLTPRGRTPAPVRWPVNRRFVRLDTTQQPVPGLEPEIIPADPYLSEMGMGDVPTYKPGDIIRVKVLLQPFRADPVWREFSIKVPEDFTSGSTALYIHGGGDLMSWNELGGKGRSLFGMGPVIDLEDRDLDAILEQITSAPLNNELLLTLGRPYDYEAEMNGDNSEDLPDNEKPEPTVDEIYQMEWVIYNSYFLPVNILTEEDAKEMDEMEQEMKDAEAGNGDDEEGHGSKDRGNDDDEEEYESKLPF